MTVSEIPDSLPVLKENLIHKRYLSVWDRKVRFPNGKVYDWDVVGLDVPPPAFVVVVPYFTATKTTSLIREWCQGPNGKYYTFPAGQFDRQHTDDVVECAKHELSQETRLAGGTWIKLLPDDHPGVCEIKWTKNLFIPFLCIDPHVDPAPQKPDDEELIEMYHNQPFSKIKELILNGEMMLPAVQSAVMATEYLRNNGFEVDTLL